MTNYLRLSNLCGKQMSTPGTSPPWHDDHDRNEVGYKNVLCPPASTADPIIAQADLNKPLYVFILYCDEMDASVHGGFPTNEAFEDMYASFVKEPKATSDNFGNFPPVDPTERAWQKFCNFTPPNNTCPASWIVYVVPNKLPIGIEDDCACEGGVATYEPSCNEPGNPVQYMIDCCGNCVPTSMQTDGICHDGSEIPQNYVYSPSNGGGFVYANLKCIKHSCSYGNCSPTQEEIDNNADGIECCGIYTDQYKETIRTRMCSNQEWGDYLGDEFVGAAWNGGCPSCSNGNDIKFIWGIATGTGTYDMGDNIADEIYEDIVVNGLGATVPDSTSTNPPFTDGQIRIFNIVNCSGSEFADQDWSTVRQRVSERLADNFKFNQNGVVVDGNYDYGEAGSVYTQPHEEFCVHALLDTMRNVLPSIVGTENGSRSVVKSAATNHVIVIPVEGGCLDSTITSGEYFGDLDDTSDLIDEFEKQFPGGKLHIQLTQNCDELGSPSNSLCSSIVCGCGEGNTSDINNSRDHKLPSSAPSEVKVAMMGLAAVNPDGVFEFVNQNCNCPDDGNHIFDSDCGLLIHTPSVDFSRRRSNDFNNLEAGDFFTLCCHELFCEWESSNFPSGIPHQSTLVHAMGGAKCLDIDEGLTTDSEWYGLRSTMVVSSMLSSYLGNAYAGPGMEVGYDSFNYPNANWIDMLNMCLQQILGRGVTA